MKLNKMQLVRLSEDDYRELWLTAERLGFHPAEITRRSLRIALPILRDFNLPGAPKPRPEPTKAA